MGGTPIQYLSTASARVFLSSKLRSHKTYGWGKTKNMLEGGMKVKDSWGERTEAERRNNKCEKGHIKVSNNSHNYSPTARHQIARCNIATTN